jgi:hypothetical protein
MATRLQCDSCECIIDTKELHSNIKFNALGMKGVKNQLLTDGVGGVQGLSKQEYVYSESIYADLCNKCTKELTSILGKMLNR